MTETSAMDDERLAGIEYRVIRHERVGSLEEAAERRGVAPSAIVKTMVVRKGENDYVFVLVPGDRVIDWPKLRAHVGERRLSMPDADEALDVTGYVRGTITPFGATHPWPVIADSEISSGVASIGGGAPGVSFTIDGRDLCACLEAGVADVTRPRVES